MTLILSGTNGLSDVDGSASTPAIRGTDSNTGIFFPAADTIAFAEGGAEVARFDSSGNLGIGTSSPNERMTIASSTAASYLQICDSSTGTTSGDGLFLGSFNGAAEIKTKENKELQFGTNNTERARIDSSGNFMVGATVQGGDGITLAPRSSGSNTTSQITFNRASTTTLGAAVAFQNGGSTVGNITYTNAAVAYNTTSDYRLKEDVQPMAGALDRVAALKPCTYKWKDDGSAGEGFIAHELQAVVPGCVTGEKDAVDAEGNIVPQGIDTSFLVATLTAAIQEQQALIESLTARIAALEGAK